MIRRRPLTIVSAHRALGKSTAINAYLSRVKGKKIWQAVRGVSLQGWLCDFLMLLEGAYPGENWGGEAGRQRILEAEDPAGRVSVYLKNMTREDMLFFVLDMRTAPNRAILSFLYLLARQNIHHLAIVVFSDSHEFYGYDAGMDSYINLITDNDFLMGPADIKSGYGENGIELTCEEAALLYACTNGWAPLVQALYLRVASEGKERTWQSLRPVLETWKTRIGIPLMDEYDEALKRLLTYLSPLDAFTPADAEEIAAKMGVEAALQSVLCLPPLLYFHDQSGLYHLHCLIGTIPVNLTFKGVGISDKDVNTLSSADEIEVSEVIFLANPMEVSPKMLENKKAQVAFLDGTKRSATTHLLDTSVLTKDEIRGMLEKHNVDSAWVLSQLDTGEYSYMLLAAMDTPLNYLYWRETCSVSVTTSEVHPISLLFDP